MSPTPADNSILAGDTSRNLPPEEITPALKASIRDGIGHAGMVGFGENFLGAFGVFLQASVTQIALLATLPQLASAVSQNLGVWFIERYPDRREILVRGIIVNAMTWGALALLALLAVPATVESSAPVPWILIILAMAYFASAGFTNPVWSSLIGDLVRPEFRGRFFGKRSRWNGFATFSAMLLAGQILTYGQGTIHENLGFALIFCFAFILRSLSAYYTTHYDNPPFSYRREHHFSFVQFLRRAPWSNFARFVFFLGTINFGVAFSAPFFAVHMLRDLKFSYGTFTMLTAIVTVTQFLTMQLWGRISDQFGNKKILNICAYGVALSPLPWLFTERIELLIFAQIYSGVVWAGYNLASTNFIFDAVTPPKIPRCAAYQALVSAIFFFLGSLVGSTVAESLSHPGNPLSSSLTFAHPLLPIFFLSSICRLIAVTVFLPRFQEVRTVQPIQTKELLFRIVGYTPLLGSSFEVISSIRKKHFAPKD